MPFVRNEQMTVASPPLSCPRHSPSKRLQSDTHRGSSYLGLHLLKDAEEVLGPARQLDNFHLLLLQQVLQFVQALLDEALSHVGLHLGFQLCMLLGLQQVIRCISPKVSCTTLLKNAHSQILCPNTRLGCKISSTRTTTSCQETTLLV